MYSWLALFLQHDMGYCKGQYLFFVQPKFYNANRIILDPDLIQVRAEYRESVCLCEKREEGEKYYLE